LPLHKISARRPVTPSRMVRLTMLQPMGLAELREAIAEKLCDENMLEVTADDVAVTPGAKMAVFAAFQALLEEATSVY